MKIILMGLLCFSCFKMEAQQKLFTKTGTITFYSKAAMENIEAANKTALAIWETASGKIEFSVLIKGFQFEKALMQEHFNDNFMESDKYPKAFFKGVVENSNTINFTSDNTSTRKVSGTLTIHGISKEVQSNATISVKNGVVSAKTVFSIMLADYNIKIPGVNINNISKQLQIVVIVNEFEKLK